MSPQEYSKLAIKLDLPEGGYESTVSPRMNNREMLRLLHGSLGLVTEAAELADAIKKFMMYGKPIDRTNLVEEIGDVLWYCNLLLDHIGSNFEDAMDANIRKLQKRYPEGFSEERAINRDVNAEKVAMEAK